jgi:hypothetical protein
MQASLMVRDGMMMDGLGESTERQLQWYFHSNDVDESIDGGRWTVDGGRWKFDALRDTHSSRHILHPFLPAYYLAKTLTGTFLQAFTVDYRVLPAPHTLCRRAGGGQTLHSRRTHPQGFMPHTLPLQPSSIPS